MHQRVLITRALGVALVVVLALGAPMLVRFAGVAADDTRVRSDGSLVDLGNHRVVRVLEAGDRANAPVVLVHGLPSNVGDWADLPETLAALGHRVIFYDRIGYGRSSPAAQDGDEFSYGSNARDLLALLDRLGIARATLVGWSYGGGIVQLVAERAPERVAQLVLVASVGSDAIEPDHVSRIARSAIGPSLCAWVIGVPPLARSVVSVALADAFSGGERVPAGWIERTWAQLARPGTLRSWIEEDRRMDPSQIQPERVAAPTLVLQGDADRLVPMRIAEGLRGRLPHATLEVVPGGSHMLPVTHTARLATRIHEWTTELR